MRRKLLLPTLIVALGAVSGLAAPIQITSSGGDSRLERFGPASTSLAAIASSGDLTPGAPGNADGSREVYLLDLATGVLVQITASTGDASSARVTGDPAVIIGSRADLTPGGPGNPDASFESYVYTVATGSLAQMTSSSEDSFFQSFWNDGKRALFVSKGDLTPGAPGNPDGRNEVFWFHLKTGSMTQLTASPEESLARGIDPRGRFAVIQSKGDLSPGAPGNADATWETYLLDLKSLTLTQITASAGDSGYRGVSRNGRWLAIESTGDLTPGAPGNADGSREVYLFDTEGGGLTQVTASPGDSFVAGLGPRSRRMAIVSRANLVLGPPGNTDGSLETFIRDLRTGELYQLTASSADSRFGGFEPRKGKWAALVTGGDLVFAKLRRNPRKTILVKATNGGVDLVFSGFSPRGRFAAVDAAADLVRGENADGSREVFIARARRRPTLKQVTSSREDSAVAGFAPDARTLLIESRGDLDPRGAGNTDGSLEVFRFGYR